MYCNCGCGKITPTAKRNLYDRGIKKGEHLHYIHGHNSRKVNYHKELIVICGLYKKGHSTAEVSRIMGINNGTIKYRLKQEGIIRDRIEAVVFAHKNGLIPHPGNKNPCSEEAKRTISKSLTGRTYPNRKKSVACGVNHWNWKGGRTSHINKLRRTDEYKKWRNEVYKRDGWTCRNCKDKPRRIVAHHIKSFTAFPKLRFNVDNGITLCRKCHKKEHSEIGLETRFGSRLYHDKKNPHTQVFIEIINSNMGGFTNG